MSSASSMYSTSKQLEYLVRLTDNGVSPAPSNFGC